MIKGYVIEFNVRCVKTGKKYPDSIIPSAMFGDTFTDIMKDTKVGDTSIGENIEGLWDDENITVPVIYDQMYVVTEITSWQISINNQTHNYYENHT